LAYLMFGSKAAFALAFLACACGGTSSDGQGAAGANAGVILGMGGGGASSNGLAGSNGHAGASSNGAAGSSSSGAGNSAGAANSGSACPAVTPCGGDPVGDWAIKQMCIGTAMAAASAACPGATQTLSPITATGTLSFTADGNTTSSAVISFTETAQLPASCYTEANCTTLLAALSADSTVTNAQCNYDADTGCTCSLASTQPTMSSGTYQVQGTTLSITSATNGKTENDGFCVSGNTLTLINVNASGLASTAILTK